jgi:hypothetical protein
MNPLSGLRFRALAPEGAILTMPEGAISEDLENLPRFREYAFANVKKWYKYINGPLGREAKNGDVRLVIGCDKATSWGMAALSNAIRHSQFKFKPLDAQSPSSRSCGYTWEYSGFANAKVGPDEGEVNELREGLDVSATPDKFLNQCLFVRTMNVALSDDDWESLNCGIGIGCATGTPSHSPSSRSAPSDGTQSTSSTTPGNIGIPRMASHSFATEVTSPGASVNRLTISAPPTATVSTAFETGVVSFNLNLSSHVIPPASSMKFYLRR